MIDINPRARLQAKDYPTRPEYKNIFPHYFHYFYYDIFRKLLDPKN
eukprot:UN14348